MANITELKRGPDGQPERCDPGLGNSIRWYGQCRMHRSKVAEDGTRSTCYCPSGVEISFGLDEVGTAVMQAIVMLS
jgi:hypothetical protein